MECDQPQFCFDFSEQGTPLMIYSIIENMNLELPPMSLDVDDMFVVECVDLLEPIMLESSSVISESTSETTGTAILSCDLMCADGEKDTFTENDTDNCIRQAGITKDKPVVPLRKAQRKTPTLTRHKKIARNCIDNSKALNHFDFSFLIERDSRRRISSIVE
jgi:hypothetical protein